MMRIRGPVDKRPRIEPYVPYWSHISGGAVLLEDGSRLAMAHVEGLPHELCDAEQRNQGVQLLNRIWRDLGDDNVTICVHFVRDKSAPEAFVSPKFRNEFSKELYKAYYDAVICDRLYTNDWYVTLIVSQRGVPIGTTEFRRKIARSLYQFRKNSDRQVADTSELEALWLQLARNLAGYTVERLGYRYNATSYHRYSFSEIGEAMKRFLGLADDGVPITTGRLGTGICNDSDQPIFERRIFRILPPGCDDDSDDAEGVRWGALFGIKDYMQETGPDLFDAMLSLKMPLVVSHHFCFASKPDAVGHLVRTRRQMKATKDAGTKQRKGLKKAASQAQSGEEARGEHDVSIAVYADSYSDLIRNSAVARATLVNTGAQIVQETGANMAQYFGQLPGNFHYCAHPGKIGSQDFAHLANFGAFPRGEKEGKWGPAMLRFVTTALTGYDFVPHVEDVGMTAVFGVTGSGKTVLLCMLMAMLDQYMVGNNGLIILFDKDDGCCIFIEAIGGNYLTIRFGEDSGLAPLLGFKEDTPYARAALTGLFHSLILQDGLGPIKPEHYARIARGVAAELRLPLPMRSMVGLRQFLDWEPGGAGARFERWCRGGALGWLFDGAKDLVDFEAPAVGFNLGRLLENQEVLEPATQYLRDRILPVIDGRRAVGVFDEAGKYMASSTYPQQISDFWTTWRKLNGIGILATQDPGSFLKSDIGRTILAQCLTMVFFPTAGASRRVYCGDEEDGGLGCTEGEFEAIAHGMAPGSHQFLLKRRGIKAESVICNFDLSGVPPWMMHVMSGAANRVKLWNDLNEKLPKALAAFAARSKEVVD